MSLKLEDIMVEDVISVSEGAAVRDVAELMDRHKIGCLVVVKNAKPVGIVTETDIVARVTLKMADPEKTKVNEIMSKSLVIGNPEMSIDDAMKIMRRQKIKKLPVVEKGRLVGLVTTTDIVRSPVVMKMMIRSIRTNVFQEILMSVQEKMDLEK